MGEKSKKPKTDKKPKKKSFWGKCCNCCSKKSVAVVGKIFFYFFDLVFKLVLSVALSQSQIENKLEWQKHYWLQFSDLSSKHQNCHLFACRQHRYIFSNLFFWFSFPTNNHILSTIRTTQYHY